MMSTCHGQTRAISCIVYLCVGLIVTDDVIESDHSLVIPEAANREISAEVVLKRVLESL